MDKYMVRDPFDKMHHYDLIIIGVAGMVKGND